MNPFDLLGDVDDEDPSQLIAAQQKATATKKLPNQTQAKQPPAAAATKPSKLPSKPLPPAQAGKLFGLPVSLLLFWDLL